VNASDTTIDKRTLTNSNAVMTNPTHVVGDGATARYA
jgi:hypothetical protein